MTQTTIYGGRLSQADSPIKKFEIIGEAAKHIPEEIRNQYPQIKWKQMAGMRDRLIHFYFGIKYDLVWHTIKDVIPQIKPIIESITKDIKKQEKL